MGKGRKWQKGLEKFRSSHEQKGVSDSIVGNHRSLDGLPKIHDCVPGKFARVPKTKFIVQFF